MGWWLSLRETLTIPFLEMRYEDLVRDLETHARQMVDLLGLEWSDEMLRFQQMAQKRVISTPSYEAVTEKPHTRAIGRWRDYREQFEPLLGQLEPFVEAFGYRHGPAVGSLFHRAHTNRVARSYPRSSMTASTREMSAGA